MVRVGEKLRQERIKQGYTLEEVSKQTKIKLHFLSAIERGEYQKLPSSAYAYGFVQNYVEFLKLPKRDTIAMFRREFDAEKIYKVLPQGFQRHKEPIFHGVRFSHMVFVVAILFVLLSGFILFQYRYAIISPPLTITSPENGLIVEGEVTVSGHTDPNAVVTVNGQPTPVSEGGEFIKRIALFEGDEKVIVTATHRLGKKTIVEREIVVK